MLFVCRHLPANEKVKNPSPEGPALVHPGGVMAFNRRVQVSGFPPKADQVSATKFDTLCRSRTINGLSFTSVGCQLQPNQCSGFRIRCWLICLRQKTWSASGGKPRTDLIYGRANHLWPGPEDQVFYVWIKNLYLYLHDIIKLLFILSCINAF